VQHRVGTYPRLKQTFDGLVEYVQPHDGSTGEDSGLAGATVMDRMFLDTELFSSKPPPLLTFDNNFSCCASDSDAVERFVTLCKNHPEGFIIAPQGRTEERNPGCDVVVCGKANKAQPRISGAQRQAPYADGWMEP